LNLWQILTMIKIPYRRRHFILEFQYLFPFSLDRIGFHAFYVELPLNPVIWSVPKGLIYHGWVLNSQRTPLLFQVHPIRVSTNFPKFSAQDMIFYKYPALRSFLHPIHQRHQSASKLTCGVFPDITELNPQRSVVIFDQIISRGNLKIALTNRINYFYRLLISLIISPCFTRFASFLARPSIGVLLMISK
jgi:hypothetical protein